LNEIIVRYMEPMNDLLHDALNFKYFYNGTREEIEGLLREQKSVNKTRIPYYLHLSFKHKGRLILSYLPGKTVRHEIVTLTPDGYRYRGVVHYSLDQLMKYFKKTGLEKPPDVSGRASVTPSSSFAYGRPQQQQQQQQQQPQKQQQQQRLSSGFLPSSTFVPARPAPFVQAGLVYCCCYCCCFSFCFLLFCVCNDTVK